MELSGYLVMAKAGGNAERQFTKAKGCPSAVSTGRWVVNHGRFIDCWLFIGGKYGSTALALPSTPRTRLFFV